MLDISSVELESIWWYVSILVTFPKTEINKVDFNYITSKQSELTRSGCHNDSHIPYICSEQVPLTTKSPGTMGQPIKSIEAMKGSDVIGSNPAMTGSTKYGPNLKRK